MRIPILIISVFYTCFVFGQDSLQLDTNLKSVSNPIKENTINDTSKSVLKNRTAKNKIKLKKKQDQQRKEEPKLTKEINTLYTESSGNHRGILLILIIVIGIVMFSANRRSSSKDIFKNTTDRSKGDDIISDYLSRMVLSRREYYRNVYLKSDAWKRKRFVVLKRDNWRCVYCGGRATQVHHTRYAKKNIGKEPIEWLVSICITCHKSKHL